MTFRSQTINFYQIEIEVCTSLETLSFVNMIRFNTKYNSFLPKLYFTLAYLSILELQMIGFSVNFCIIWPI